MDISHLYHDATFGDPTIELDVKEQLRTRIVNAREDRNLEMLSKSYEKAKFICEKNTAWERWKVGQSLHGIWERSPKLDRSLALEKARVEQLQRSILMKNFHMRHKPFPQEVKPVSPMMRSVSNTTLDPIHPDMKLRKRRRQRRKDKKPKEDADGLTHSITERHLQRQGEFARRTEHVVKSLAKLNFRQQNRRRDHEKFKEELKLHSKPVIEKARVVLKGRSDVDVETMMTDFENILLPQRTAETSVNSTNSRNSKQSDIPMSLSKSDILHMPDDAFSRLPSMSDTSGSNVTHFKTDGRNSNSDSLDGVFESTSPRSSVGAMEDTGNATEKRKLNSDSKEKQIQNSNTARPNQPSPPSQSQGKSSQIVDDKSTSSPCSNSDKGVVSPARSRARNLVVGGYEGRRGTLVEVFSPSTSVSQVIIEEDEDEGETSKENKGVDANESAKLFDNNNSSNVESKPSSAVHQNYTLTHTTGLPQLWKLAIKKKKEKTLPEVSAATIARKHRKKRSESERTW